MPFLLRLWWAGFFLLQAIACRPQVTADDHFFFPPGDHPTEFSLNPQDCGKCHTSQYNSWRMSLHARAVSPGLLWQLSLFDPETRGGCLDCHAPLSGQKKIVARENDLAISHAGGMEVPAPGLVCASCHVRDGQVFGPGYGNQIASGDGGHPISKQRDVFRDSTFCVPCHQRPETGKRVNGKLLMDVYDQYLRSGFPEQGVTCQGCHMPGRLHGWAGISDQAFTEGALSLTYDIDQDFLNVRLRNKGVGHYFPAYSVPLAIIKVADQKGKILAEQKIGWQLDTQLTTELFDTRIPFNREMVLSIRLSQIKTKKLSAYLEVYPSDFYNRMFREQFQRETKSSFLPEKALNYLKTAISASENSYIILQTPISAP